MRALVWQRPGVMLVEDVAPPRPAPGEVVLQVDAAGICGSDVTAFLGHMGTARPGSVRGHELAGTVVETDPGDAGLLGARVAVNPLVSCGSCPACRRGADNQCPHQQSIGIQRPGGFAEQVLVPVRNLVPVPADLDDRTVATAEPLAQACHDVQLALRVGGGGSALVVGAGAIGLLVVQAARLLGLGPVTVLEPNASRRRAAAAAGAAVALAGPEEVDAQAGDLPEQGWDVVLDVVGTDRTRRDGLRWTRRGGVLVLVGLHEDETALPWRDVIRREVVVLGSNASDAGDFAQAVEWLVSGRAGLGTPQDHVPLEAGPETLARLAGGGAGPVKTFLRARAPG